VEGEAINFSSFGGLDDDDRAWVEIVRDSIHGSRAQLALLGQWRTGHRLDPEVLLQPVEDQLEAEGKVVNT